jgi:hypothetical protein
MKWLIILVIFISGCTSGDYLEESKPVLYNLGVDIPDAFVFDGHMKDYFLGKVFIEFGTEINGSSGLKRLPEITYVLPEGTPVISPVNGVITMVGELYSEDYYISIRTSEDSAYLVSLEHVINVKVSSGDVVSAGDVLGEVAPYSGGYWFTEIAVWVGGRTITKYCPFDFLDESLKLEYADRINTVVYGWEEFVGYEVYDTADWTSPGCFVESFIEIV